MLAIEICVSNGIPLRQNTYKQINNVSLPEDNIERDWAFLQPDSSKTAPHVPKKNA